MRIFIYLHIYIKKTAFINYLNKIFSKNLIIENMNNMKSFLKIYFILFLNISIYFILGNNTLIFNR